MNVYENITLKGLHVSKDSVLIGVCVKSLKEVGDWNISSNLMFGNLLCISFGGDFKQLFWGTVEDKNRMNEENIVIIKPFNEWNDITLSEFLIKLQEADLGMFTLMVFFTT